jgi:membrane-bound serine protease (ClpP class)
MPTWQTVQVGDVGVSTSSLRPSGKIEVGGAIVDVVSEGEFIDPGTSVRIITKKGARIVVRKV